MPDQALTKRATVGIVLGVLVALSFLVAALVTYIQEGDWPARYVSASITILAVILIAVKRRTSR